MSSTFFIAVLLLLFSMLPVEASSLTASLDVDHVHLTCKMDVLFPSPLPIDISGRVKVTSMQDFNETLKKYFATAYAKNFAIIIDLNRDRIQMFLDADIYGVVNKTGDVYVANLKWRYLRFEGKVFGDVTVSVGGISLEQPFDFSFIAQLDLSPFKVPLEEWNVTVINGREALLYNSTERQIIETPWGTFTIDPTMIILLPAGASRVFTKGDEVAFTMPYVVMPPWLIYLVAAMLTLGALLYKRSEVKILSSKLRGRVPKRPWHFSRKPSLRYCRFCGKCIRAEATFCPYCGKRVSKTMEKFES
jgi:hypothetical protein